MKKDFLHNKQDGFKLPDNYFEQFESNLFSAIDKKSDLELPKQSGFKTPTTYFEDVELTIMAAIAKENKKVKPTFFKKYKYAISAAAAIVIGLVTTFTFYSPSNTPTLDSLAASEIEDYIEEGYIPVNSYEIGEIFSDEISEVSITSSTIDDNDIIDYLSAYNITNEQY